MDVLIQPRPKRLISTLNIPIHDRTIYKASLCRNMPEEKYLLQFRRVRHHRASLSRSSLNVHRFDQVFGRSRALANIEIGVIQQATELVENAQGA